MARQAGAITTHSSNVTVHAGCCSHEPTQLHTSDGNHKPTLWSQTCWWCECAPPPRLDPRTALWASPCLALLKASCCAAAPSLLPPCKVLPGAMLLPALPQRHCLVPADGSPDPGRAQVAQAPTGQPSSPPLPSSGWQRVAHATPLPPHHTGTCTSLPLPGTQGHKAALALLLLSPKAAVPA